MSRPGNLRAALACFALLSLIACGTPQAYRFYTLSAEAGSESPSPKTSGYRLVVGPVSVPEDIDRPQLLIRRDPYQVSLDDGHRWAGPLRNDIPRVVAENLSTLLGTPKVTLTLPEPGVEADIRVSLEILRFEGTLGDAARLDAIWIIKRLHNGPSLSGRTQVRETVDNAEHRALVAAYSRALATLSRDIARGIQGL